MIYVAGFFVDIDDIGKLWLLSFSERNMLFIENLTLSPLSNFGLVYFMIDFLYKIVKKSLFFTSLGVFPGDWFLRQFVQKEIVPIWEQFFRHDIHHNDYYIF